MSPVTRFVSALLHSRTQVHIFHLQTQSYAAHKAYQRYYEDVVDVIDKYVESYQGRYGIMASYEPITQLYTEDAAVKYFTGLLTFVDTIKSDLPTHGELKNIVDEITTLITSTLYKIKFLK
jgi:hypothetical protein